MLEPLKKTRLYEEIVKQLVDLINKGSLKPGDRLPTERELAVQLKVSRTAIREALRSLEMMGFIESKVGEGTFIKEITLNNVLDPFSNILLQDKKLIIELIEVRLLLESEIAKLAAGKINADKAAEMKNSLDLMEREIAEGGIGIKGENEFHNALARASENSAMSKILGMCGELLSASRLATLEIADQPRKSLEDHRKIYDAIRSGNKEESANLMREHLIKAQRNLENLERKSYYNQKCG